MYASFFAPPNQQQAYSPIAKCAEPFSKQNIIDLGKGMGIPEEEVKKQMRALDRINADYGQGKNDPRRALMRELETIRHGHQSGNLVGKHNKVNMYLEGRREEFHKATNDWDAETEALLDAELKGGFVDGIFLNTFGQCVWWCSAYSTDNLAKSSWYWFWKYFAMIFALAMYIMCLAFIAGVQLSVDACHAGLVNANFNANTTTHCDSMIEDCKFRWLTSYRETGVGDYLKWRLASYILSLLPLMFMAYASGRHMKNTVNKLLDKHERKTNEATSQNGIKLKYWGNLLSKGRLETISLILFFVVYIVIGSLILALDVQFAKFLNTGGDEGGSKCKASFNENSQYIPFLQPNQTPETLCKILLSFNVFSMIWSMFYVVVTTYATCCGHIKREEAAKAIARSQRQDFAAAQAHPHVHAAAPPTYAFVDSILHHDLPGGAVGGAAHYSYDPYARIPAAYHAPDTGPV